MVMVLIVGLLGYVESPLRLETHLQFLSCFVKFMFRARMVA